jgi:hypothetical protein
MLSGSIALPEYYSLLNFETEKEVFLSLGAYAMAALPLAVDPIQKIHFIPYAHQRFNKFLAAYEQFTR